MSKALQHNRSTSTLSHPEFCTVVGLLELAQGHNLALASIEEALRAITLEIDYDGKLLTGLGGGHTGDAVYGSDRGYPAASQLLERLGLTVEEFRNTLAAQPATDQPLTQKEERMSDENQIAAEVVTEETKTEEQPAEVEAQTEGTEGAAE